jgi:hypothetical protein
LEKFTELLARHLETFRELERLQVAAFDSMKNRILEGLADLLGRQQAVTVTIAREKAELRPYLDQWEALEPDERRKLREGKPGEIQEALETVAQAIQARHQEWFGSDAEPPGTAPPAGSGPAATGEAGTAADESGKGQAGDLSQLINLYRSLQ